MLVFNSCSLIGIGKRIVLSDEQLFAVSKKSVLHVQAYNLANHTTTLWHQYNGYMTLGQFALMANPTIQHAVQF